MQYETTDDLELLMNVLPPHICESLRRENKFDNLLEVVLDLGRKPEARYIDHEKDLSDHEVTSAEIDYVVQRIGDFGDDNRAGIERTLHRISAIRNRQRKVIGLTCRVGRAVFGTVEIVQDIIESGKSVLLLGKPGVGKCITSSSLILTENGLQPLAALIPDNLDDDQFAPIKTRVFGLQEMEAASHAYNGGHAETFKITTRQGFSLEGTREHPVLALTETGELAFRRLDQLRPGDYLAIQRGQQCFGDETCLPSFEFSRRTNARDGKLPVELTEELGRLLGHLIAEGTLSYEGVVGFSNTDPEVQADMAHLTESLFGLRLRRHLSYGEWNGKDFRIFGVKFRRFLSHLGLTQGRAADKRIPPCILTAPKPIVTAFLQALFEGDGSIYGPDARIEISSASRELLSQLHVLLLNYGMVGNLRSKYNAEYDRDYYHLTLLGENVLRFADEVGFLSTTKRTKLATLLALKAETPRNPNLDVVPHQSDRLRALRADVETPSQKFYRFTRSDNRAPSYRTLQFILAEARGTADTPAYQTLHELVKANFFFDSVQHIEEGEAYVYDLSVPGSHSFFANGFICHNTTLLRETARILGDKKRVVIVDTSNEIGGDGDIPHPAIGQARRMQVTTPTLQHEVMIEAVENHMPEVIVIDEIGRELEAEAARTIAERGVQLIGTAHGNTLDNLMMNPTLADLIGGIQSVTLSDEEARRRGTQKSILERKAPPTFEVVIEIQDRDQLNVHHDVAAAVDSLLRGKQKAPELRYRDASGQVKVEHPTLAAAVSARARSERAEAGLAQPPLAVDSHLTRLSNTRTLRAYPYGVSQSRLQQVARSLQVPAVVVNDLEEADVVLTLKNYYRKRPQRISEAERRGIPIYVLRSNSPAQLESCLADIFGIERRDEYDPFEEAAEETRMAIEAIRSGRRSSVELAPQNASVRRHQHEMAREADLLSRSHGKEPKRSVRIYQNNG